MMGKMLYEGLGVEQDKFVATELFLDAAKSGLAEAQFAYAVAAQTGDGVKAPDRLFFLPKETDLGDPFVAYVWGTLAFLNGFRTEESTQLIRVAKIMAGERINEVESIIYRCIDSEYEECPTI